MGETHGRKRMFFREKRTHRGVDVWAACRFNSKALFFLKTSTSRFRGLKYMNQTGENLGRVSPWKKRIFLELFMSPNRNLYRYKIMLFGSFGYLSYKKFRTTSIRKKLSSYLVNFISTSSYRATKILVLATMAQQKRTWRFLSWLELLVKK